MQNPGQVTILAIGPLTNIAMAMRMEPRFAGNVKQLVIMGGAIASLPDGGGNHTPNAEFNFYVDPEAAQIVLRSGIPIVLSPLNVSRKARFTKADYDKIVAVDTPITRLMKDNLGPGYQQRPDRIALDVRPGRGGDPGRPAADQDRGAVRGRRHRTHGANYGVSVGGPQTWPGGEGRGEDAGPDRPRLGQVHPPVRGAGDAPRRPRKR